MVYHLVLCKGMSYSNMQLTATRQHPDAYTSDKAIADKAVASGFFKLVEEPAQAAPKTHLVPEQLSEMGIKELKSLATDMGIDTKNLKSKEALISAITAEEVTPGQEADSEDNEPDYGENE